MARSKYKPLSFSTTMRNPERIASFLKCVSKYENKVLTNDIIMEVVREVIRKKLYKPTYISKVAKYKNIYDNPEATFSNKDLDDIIKNSPQQHKEAGFDAGWPSRFDTWYKLSMEFGFIYYAINEKIVISDIGKMLIEAIDQENVDDQKIQNVFLNSMMKYQIKNPFRKNLNDNVPLLLLLQVIEKLKKDDDKSAGIFRQELSFFICWPNNDANSLYSYIKDFRKKYKFSEYTDEIIYDACLEILGADVSDRNYFKMDKITGEAIDEYIRKMRITGIVSLRGNGRFLDFNTFEMDKINYVLKHYSSYTLFTDKKAYFDYIGKPDDKVLEIKRTVTKTGEDEIRKATLHKYATQYKKEEIFDELQKVCNKKESSDKMLRIIAAPARFEFLTNIALVQNFEGLDVCPNYIIDDEGLPTSHAGGNMADIVCKENEDTEALVEVTLMCGRQQVNNEMLSIERHLNDTKTTYPDAFAIFVAPAIHPDAKRYTQFVEFKDSNIIKAFGIDDFITNIDTNTKITDLVTCA
jgi:hypothetical protein